MHFSHIKINPSCEMRNHDVGFDQAGCGLVTDSDVPLLSPFCSPWVSQNPCTVLLISYQQAGQSNVVIVTIVVNSTCIELPSVSVNWHWKWSVLGQGILNIVRLIDKHWPWLCVIQKLSGSRNWLAVIFPNHEWVLAVQNNTCVFDVVQGPIGEGTLATFTTVFGVSAAVQKLLFWEVVQSFVLYSQDWLHCASCRKSPTRSTITLITDWSN